MTAPAVRPLVWPGGAALSGFRLEKLLADVRARLPAITGVSARLVHFIDLAAPLGEPEARTLADLLDDGSPAADDLPGTVLVVVPRAGTVSPWSSKATDIARSSGLDAVRPARALVRTAGRTTPPDERYRR